MSRLTTKHFQPTEERYNGIRNIPNIKNVGKYFFSYVVIVERELNNKRLAIFYEMG
jgi:hypothetical protein